MLFCGKWSSVKLALALVMALALALVMVIPLASHLGYATML
jgi:hypothetical protein